MATTIRTDSRDHAIADLRAAFAADETLPRRVEIDGGEILYPRGRHDGIWVVESDMGTVRVL